MRRASLALLLALFLHGAAAQSPPVLTAQWTPSNRVLLVQRHISGCLYLVGAGLPDKWLDVPCDDSPVLLRSGGIDYLEAPQGRTVELRAPNGERLGSVAVPERVWTQTLVLVVHQNTPP